MTEQITERKAQIYYISLPDEMKKSDKLDWFMDNKLPQIPFERIRPDSKGYWLNITNSDFKTLIPVCSKQGDAVFKLSTLGVSTNRDNWVYDFNKANLENKIKYFIEKYNSLIDNYIEKEGEINLNEFWNNSSIKWSASLKNSFLRKEKLKFNKKLFTGSLYRPYISTYYYSDEKLSDRLTKNHYQIFGKKFEKKNVGICFSGLSSSKKFQTLMTNRLLNLDFLEKTNYLPLYCYDSKGNRTENITDWGLQQFQNHYSNQQDSENLTVLLKEDIFYYIYAVFHYPRYSQKYEHELKREYPRIPFYPDFQKWYNWGKQLANIHLQYETLAPYKLEVINNDIEIEKPKVKLKADKERGEIIVDENTIIKGIPALAWQYKLGSRSAIEWILDQYKEKEPSEPVIAESFNPYQFADYKNYVITLIQRTCSVSIRTMQIINEMQSTEKQ